MIELRPGETLALHAVAPATTVLRVAFEWDAVLNNRPFEIDLAAFLLDARDRTPGDRYLVFYNNPRSPCRTVLLHQSEDSASGDGGAATTTFTVDLARVPYGIRRLSVAAVIYAATARRQHFGQVRCAHLQLGDAATAAGIARYVLPVGECGAVTAVLAGELRRATDGWAFAAGRGGVEGGLAALCRRFGLAVR
jgi:tellurium resistance protein TerD